MKIQAFLTIVSVILLGLLLFFTLNNNTEKKLIQKQLDSACQKIQFYEQEKVLLEKENDSLTKINDSLKFKSITTIFTEIKYKYGKEINLLDSSGINHYLNILAE